MLRFAVFISQQRARDLAPNNVSLLVAVTSFVTVGRDFAIQNLLLEPQAFAEVIKIGGGALHRRIRQFFDGYDDEEPLPPPCVR